MVSLKGEFVDKQLENEYFDHEVGNMIKYLKPLVLALGILYFLFIIPDYFLIKDGATFKLILLNRIVFLILVFLFYIKLSRFQSYASISYWITAYEIICTLLFLLVAYQYESPDFLIHTFGLMVIITAIFLVPNKWKYMVTVSIVVSSTFFIISAHILGPIKFSHFSAAVVYMLIVIVLNSISSWRINYYKRIEYHINQKLRVLSTTDALTKIYNRHKFDEELQDLINYCRRYKTELSLILFDIDDFKNINDEYGHLIGDTVLVDLAEQVKNLIRKTDIFARWGGEEFVILLPNTNVKRAVKIAEKTKQRINNHSFKSALHITCSFGVVSFYPEDDLDSLINRADQLLYSAKNSGKNTIVCS